MRILMGAIVRRGKGINERRRDTRAPPPGEVLYIPTHLVISLVVVSCCCAGQEIQGVPYAYELLYGEASDVEVEAAQLCVALALGASALAKLHEPLHREGILMEIGGTKKPLLSAGDWNQRSRTDPMASESQAAKRIGVIHPPEIS